MPQPRRNVVVPSDEVVAELAGIYEAAQQRLERLVREALERGAEGTAAYRRRQLAAVTQILADLRARAEPLTAQTIADAYARGAVAAERALAGRPAIAFGRVHQQAIAVLADNATRRLGEAARTVGRRTDDAFRRAALREAAVGVAAGQARREVSAELARRLVEDGVTDALTGFVDRAGKRWPLDAYARMVARTTTREAVTQGTVNRLLERGDDLVTISSHLNPCEVCAGYDGNTYSLSGQSADHPALEAFPPFHPNCRHVLTPAAANLDAFEAGLRAAA